MDSNSKTLTTTTKKLVLKKDVVRELGAPQTERGGNQISHASCTIMCHTSGTGHLCC